MMRQEGSIEGALQAKLQLSLGTAKGSKGKEKKISYENYEGTFAKNVTITGNTKKANILFVNIMGEEIIHTSSVGESLV